MTRYKDAQYPAPCDQEDARGYGHVPGRRRFLGLLAAVAGTQLVGQNNMSAAEVKRDVYLVPNFHPASCGWLTTFSQERVYCANSYLTHLDRVGKDPHYAFVLSEVNNIIAIMNFRPDRMAELRERIREQRVELVNGMFLEPTINAGAHGCVGLALVPAGP